MSRSPARQISILAGLTAMVLGACANPGGDGSGKPATHSSARHDMQQHRMAGQGSGSGARAPIPEVDLQRIPPSAAGHGDRRVLQTGKMPRPAGDGVAAFRTVCDFSHMNFDDPLVFPGEIGRSHLHLFVGNTSVDAMTNDMRAKGNSTCRGGTVNRTGYWVPAIIDTATGAPVAPSIVHIYYKTGYRGVRNQDVRPWPQGLRMLAGDPTNQRALPSHARNWRWHCHTGKYDPRAAIPTDCPSGTEIVMEISFPQCWDGKNLDSPDHRSHMAYASGRGCPSTHPVPIPEITYNFVFSVPPSGAKAWRLSSDAYEGPPGYSMHADWWDGWDPEIVREIISQCINPGMDCGGGMLGKGREIH